MIEIKIEKIKIGLLEILPIIVAFVFIKFFWENNLLLTGILVVVFLISFLIKYQKCEIIFFLAGMIGGFIIEIIATSIGFEVFLNPNILEVPSWLILLWGYGFVVIRRVGNLICEKKL